MPRRVTVAELESAIRALNDLTGHPATPYRKEGDQWLPNPGVYHLSRAYGGFALHQMADHGTGTRDVLYSGHIPARELLNRIHAYRYGAELAAQATKRIHALEQDKLALMRDILAPLAV
jgi:hypothetical protein